MLDTDRRRLELEGWLGSRWGPWGSVLDGSIIVCAGVLAVLGRRVGVLWLGGDPW